MTPLPQLQRLAVAGHVMVLHQTYDPAQMWLPFVTGVVFPTVEPPEPEDKTRRLRALRYQPGVPQHVLPFAEHLRLSNKKRTDVAAAQYPHWDRVNGGVIQFIIRADRYERLIEWAYENCRFQYSIGSRRAFFANDEEAMMARMIAGG